MGWKYTQWKREKEEDLRIRRATVRPPIAASLPDKLDVAAIRLALPSLPHPCTQDNFARRFGFSVGAVRCWETGRRKPDSAARVLLTLIAHDAVTIEAAIQAAIAGEAVLQDAGGMPRNE